ncbi:MAG: 8-oxoguanine deaminase [Gammaproteobacteria bacterium]|nr:8-oxoguanine deaminase [Gammaproteobacteria bacterium]
MADIVADIVVYNAHTVATQDDMRTELRNASLIIKDGKIKAILENPEDAFKFRSGSTKWIDATKHLVIPGLINTHHHMVQCLTRAIPSVQNAELFAWLKGLYPIWSKLTPNKVTTATKVAMAELLLSGSTCSSDHLYIYPNGVRLEDSIEAAQTIGMRFVASRGSMSVGVSKGGLPPDEVVENEEFILKDTQRLIQTWHQPQDGAMIQVAVAPCSPFTVSPDLMRESALLARSYKVRLHTHLAENDYDVEYTKQNFGCTPVEYAENLGWLGEDIWYAHAVKITQPDIALFSKTGTGIAHCPCSNMRLGSGILPLRNILNAGVAVGLGVDGSASNDSGNLLNEARQSMLLARVRKSLEHMGCATACSEITARDALFLATRGGAKVLGRSDIGQISVDKCADIALFRLDTLEMSGGSVHDPIGSLLMCLVTKADYTIVNGQVIVEAGCLMTLDVPNLVEQHQKNALELVSY